MSSQIQVVFHGLNNFFNSMAKLSLTSASNTGTCIVGAFTLLTSRSRHFDPTIYTCAKKLRGFLVGSAHVRSQATVHAFMHAAHTVCMRAEDIDTRFKERA